MNQHGNMPANTDLDVVAFHEGLLLLLSSLGEHLFEIWIPGFE